MSHAPRRSSRHRGPLALAAVVALSGCADIAGPTATSSESAADEFVLPLFSVQDAGLVGGLLADLTDRVLPALPDGSVREELVAAFEVLAMALGVAVSPDGTVHDPKASLAAVDAAVTRYAAVVKDDPEATVELESLRLGLGFIQAATGL